MNKCLILLALPFLFLPSAVSACSCSSLGSSSCLGLRQYSALFLGTVSAISNPPPEDGRLDAPGESRYTFRVDERFGGVQSPEIEIYSGRGGADCSFHFQQGHQYLVSPYQDKNGRLFATVCSITRPVELAHAIIPQLRAMRDHKRVASLYGVLRRSEQPYGSVTDQIEGDPLAHTPILIRSNSRAFHTVTDGEGAYAFYGVPSGEYRIEAKLPDNLELAQTILDQPLPPLRLSMGACDEYDVDALPTGAIRGRVLGPDGNPLGYAPVELYRPERYLQKNPGLRWMESQQKSETGYFQFSHVAPGDYIIVYNASGDVTPDNPFPRSFYPGVSDVRGAGHIHVGPGEKVLGADIRLGEGKPTRRLKIHLVAEAGKLPDIHYVDAKGADGYSPGEDEISPTDYEMSLFTTVRYQVHAQGYCTATERGSQTATIEIDGADEKQSEITLVFTGPGCGQ